MMIDKDSFSSKDRLHVNGGSVDIVRLDATLKAGEGDFRRLPFCLRVLLENLLRNEDGDTVTQSDILQLLNWKPEAKPHYDISFRPIRVLLQDFTGVPAVVDLAAMRDALFESGLDPSLINPLQPVDLVVDHSVQVDAYGSKDSFKRNIELEFKRNQERYQFLKWGQKAFKGFTVVPPDTGIVHQVNLEYLATVVYLDRRQQYPLACPDTLVGTDSHTTMINGLGVLGWGVGGIEAEAAMLGQPISMLIPNVIGFELTGQLPEGITATDLVLTIVQMLRKRNVVGKLVEFFGNGLDSLSLPDRATIANMAPEYGATVGFFPVDEQTLQYLRFTGRSTDQVDLVERYCKEQTIFRVPGTSTPQYTDTLRLDLEQVKSSLAGPKRPQDRLDLKESKRLWHIALSEELNRASKDSSTGAKGRPIAKEPQPSDVGNAVSIQHGSIVIAAITSCTNTSNPSVLLAAGLLAKRALEKNLSVKPWVKTSLAPGSAVVTDYLRQAGLLESLESLGFHVVAYGCTTCIGNSGPLPEQIANQIEESNLIVVSVLSGNRNFEGRINPLVKANYLASPPLVVAYAIAGTMDIDFEVEPLGRDVDGKPVFLRDIWPSVQEVEQTIKTAVKKEMFIEKYSKVQEGTELWKSMEVSRSEIFKWNEGSTYIRKPPFFYDVLKKSPKKPDDIFSARVLALLGDSVTTDHISPAGSIALDSPAATYLQERGVKPLDFNSYGSRRGNHEVMVRGTFANIRLRNLLLPGTEGGMTCHIPSGLQMSIYDAAERYHSEKTPLLIIAGKEYGSGSSRDWAAKGTYLLGVRAVIAESFERIHRSNLVGMGVLPLELPDGTTHRSLGLTGRESYTVSGIASGLKPGKRLTVSADGQKFEVVARLDTQQEVAYYQEGGMLQFVLRQLASIS